MYRGLRSSCVVHTVSGLYFVYTVSGPPVLYILFKVLLICVSWLKVLLICVSWFKVLLICVSWFKVRLCCVYCFRSSYFVYTVSGPPILCILFHFLLYCVYCFRSSYFVYLGLRSSYVVHSVSGLIFSSTGQRPKSLCHGKFFNFSNFLGVATIT